MKKLLIIVIMMAAMAVQAQNSVTLTSGRVITGKITKVTNNEVFIRTADSTQLLICPFDMVEKYFDGTNSIYPKVMNNITPGTELKKATSTLVTGATLTGLGILAAVTGPYLVVKPVLKNDYTQYAKDIDAYDEKCKTIVFVGAGVVLLGTIIEISSIHNFKLAGKKIDAKLNGDGLGLSIKF